jgi:glycosyltransferase involved in cell wall biosynthesis
MHRFVPHRSDAAPPRVVMLGELRDALGSWGDGFHRAMAAPFEVGRVDAPPGPRGWLRAYREASSYLRVGGFEIVHALDCRFAPVGAMLSRRCGVPATITLTADALRRRGPRAAIERRSLRAFDEAFVSEEAMLPLGDRDRIGTPIYTMPSVARELPMPSARDVDRVLGALRGLEPEQPLVGVPWPANIADLRWFRDIVMPGLSTRPSFVLLGVTSRRELRLTMRVAGVRTDVRAVTGSITAGLIAAAARMVDVFAVPVPTRGSPAPRSELMMALTVSGVPVVTDAHSFDCVPAHETSGLILDPADERGFVAALDGVLRLPPVQRHCLGEEVARSALRERPWRPLVEAYAARFSSLLGRPVVPAELRAA